MTKKQFEQQLKQQAYAAVPDKREELLKTVAVQNAAAVPLSDNGDEPHLVPVVPAYSSKTVGRRLALAACFAVVLVAVILATDRDDAQLIRGESDPATTTTTAFGVVPSASGSGEISGSVSAVTASGGSQNGTETGSATLQASGSTTLSQTTATTQIAAASDTQNHIAKGGTAKENAPTVPPQTGSKWWNDFCVTTTKGSHTTKFVPGGATTQKTEAPSAKPTTKRTTAPTTPPTCRHDVTYTPPVRIDGKPNPNTAYCVQWCAYEPHEQEWDPREPTQQGTVKDDFTFTTYYASAADVKGAPTYMITTEVVFADGWRNVYRTVCSDSLVLYSTKCTYTNAGVCVYEEKYDPATETLAIVERNREGKVMYETTIKIPIGSANFQRM